MNQVHAVRCDQIKFPHTYLISNPPRTTRTPRCMANRLEKVEPCACVELITLVKSSRESSNMNLKSATETAAHRRNLNPQSFKSLPIPHLKPLQNLLPVTMRAGDCRKLPAHPRFNDTHRLPFRGLLQSCFRGLVLAAIVLGLPSLGHAQGNLVNLFNWTNESTDLPPGSQNGVIQITSANSGVFHGAVGTNGSPIQDILTGNFETIPGTIYEITYTLSHNPQFSFFADVTFGNFTTNVAPAIEANTFLGPYGYSGGMATFDYNALATTTTATMSFSFGLDNSDSFTLSNLTVTAVPEISTLQLFAFGGCALLFAQRWQRRALLKRKLT